MHTSVSGPSLPASQEAHRLRDLRRYIQLILCFAITLPPFYTDTANSAAPAGPPPQENSSQETERKQ